MTRPLCLWCDHECPPPRKPPLPEGFCGEPCAACFKSACADVGAELFGFGIISIDNLRRRFHAIVMRRYGGDLAAAASGGDRAAPDDAPATEPLQPGPSLADQTPAAVKAIALAIIVGAGAHLAGWW